jgi:hypothetical protein
MYPVYLTICHVARNTSPAFFSFTQIAREWTIVHHWPTKEYNYKISQLQGLLLKSSFNLAPDSALLGEISSSLFPQVNSKSIMAK